MMMDDMHHHHPMTTTATGMGMNGSHHGNMSSGSSGNMTGMKGHEGHEGHDMGSGMGAHDMPGMHSMKMYFHTGVTEYVLFEKCHTADDKDMAIACVVIFLVAVLYEGLKFLREVLLQRTLQGRAPTYYAGDKTAASNSQEQMVVRGPSTSISQQILSTDHGIQTFLHIIQIFVSYCLMLVFMTYNAWLCIAVVLGAGVGYFVFGWKRAMIVDSNEHCH